MLFEGAQETRPVWASCRMLRYLECEDSENIARLGCLSIPTAKTRNLSADFSFESLDS